MEFYKFQDTIELVEDGLEADWINLADPGDDELANVADLCGLSPSFLAEPLDLKEHPRVDRSGAALLILIQVPAASHIGASPFGVTVPVGVFIQAKRLITVCRQPSVVAEALKAAFDKSKSWTPMLLTGYLFRSVGGSFINALNKLEEVATQAETSLRIRPENDVLLQLLNIQKALIGLTVALKSNHGLLETLSHNEQTFGLHMSKIEKSVLDEATIEIQQAVFTAEIFNQVLASMSEVFGSIISNNLNKIMKFLAGVTIVLMVPAIIAGLYGMNVATLPGSELNHAFWLLCGLCLLLMVSVSFIFAKKKWF